MRCICGGTQGIYSIWVQGSAQQMDGYFSHVGLFHPQTEEMKCKSDKSQVVRKAVVHSVHELILAKD